MTTKAGRTIAGFIVAIAMVIAGDGTMRLDEIIDYGTGQSISASA